MLFLYNSISVNIKKIFICLYKAKIFYIRAFSWFSSWTQLSWSPSYIYAAIRWMDVSQLTTFTPLQCFQVKIELFSIHFVYLYISKLFLYITTENVKEYNYIDVYTVRYFLVINSFHVWVIPLASMIYFQYKSFSTS